MIKHLFFSFIVIANTVFAAGGDSLQSSPEIGSIAVANRASSSISIIDAATDQIRTTFALPFVGNPAEPMYVVYKENRLYVGDRANNRIVVYDSFGFNHIADIPAGAGVFHMWASKLAQRLVVNNDIDNTITVIDTNSLTVVDTLTVPDDLVQRGFKPHDIVVDDFGLSAFVSVLGGEDGGNDFVLKYNLSTGNVTARQEVGGDPHLFLSPARQRQLIVPTQETSEVSLLNTSNLRVLRRQELANAHGIFALGRRLYVSNIADGGVGALNTFDARRLRLLDSDDTPSPIPHNIVVTSNGKKIYITHSGPQDLVSVFDTGGARSTPRFLGQVQVQNNPFGLAYIPH